MRLLMCLAAAVAALPPGPPQEQKPQHPPYVVTVTAKTKFARWKETYAEFKDRVKKAMPLAQLIGREAVPNDNAGWERWRFEVSADSKLDIGLFPRVFGDMKVGKMELAIQGEAVVDMKTKIIMLTSFGEKVKVKLMNRPKKDVNDVPENQVAKILEEITGGKKHFSVSGEVFSHGGQLAIFLDTFNAVSPPAK